MTDLFRTLPLWANLAIFAAAAALVWAAGSRVATDADVVAERTGLTRTAVGLVLLGVITSLPEIATTVTAGLYGNAQLATANLFGGVAMQIAVLALVDWTAVRGALTYFTPQPILLFQGVMLVLLLAIALAGASLGEPLSLAGIGLTPVLLVLGYLVTVRFSWGEEYLPPWRALNPPELHTKDDEQRNENRSNAGLYRSIVIGAGLTLCAGWALARTGDALAEQTGLGATFVGAAFVAVSTSLPELSTSLTAVRQGNPQMAVSNILGTNCLEVALFFVADLAYRDGAILAAADNSAIFAGSIGLITTCILLVGLLERKDRTVFGMGIDSLGIAAAYLTGLGGLYYLR